MILSQTLEIEIKRLVMPLILLGILPLQLLGDLTAFAALHRL